MITTWLMRSGLDRRSSATSSPPVMPGMFQSHRMRANTSAWAAARPARLLVAVVTSAIRRRPRSMVRAICGSSSMMSTRGRGRAGGASGAAGLTAGAPVDVGVATGGAAVGGVVTGAGAVASTLATSTGGAATGRASSNVVPAPSVATTSSRPRSAWTKRRDRYRPRPVPALGLGGEEGVEQAATGAVGDAGAVVADAHAVVIGRGDQLDLDQAVADGVPAGGGVEAVDDDVEHGLADAAGAAPNPGRPGRAQHQRGLGPGAGPRDLDLFVDQRVQVDQLVTVAAAAGHARQVLDDAAEALDPALGLAHQLARRALDLLVEQVEVEQHVGQRVVHLVGRRRRRCGRPGPASR
jgi:hypothetical protein